MTKSSKNVPDRLRFNVAGLGLMLISARVSHARSRPRDFALWLGLALWLVLVCMVSPTRAHELQASRLTDASVSVAPALAVAAIYDAARLAPPADLPHCHHRAHELGSMFLPSRHEGAESDSVPLVAVTHRAIPDGLVAISPRGMASQWPLRPVPIYLLTQRFRA